MTPRKQATAFTLALETTLPGLANRNTRKTLAGTADDWAAGEFGNCSLREAIMSGVLGIIFAADDGPACVEQALVQVETPEQVASIRDAGRQVRADERSKAVRS